MAEESDNTRTLGKQLTPVDQLADEMFERGGSLSWQNEEVKPLEPVVLDLSKLSLQAYAEIHNKFRKEFGQTGYENYGKYTKVVNKVRVSPSSLQGRYVVIFTTTNIQGENDWLAGVSTMMFDVESDDLDTSYPARRENWVVGNKSGKWEMVGNYKKLYEACNGKLTNYLRTQGWRNVGEIWAVDIDRSAGFLTPPTQPTAQIGKIR